jgi:hypothetical protein
VTERKRLTRPAKPKPTKQDLLSRLKGATRKGRPNRVTVMFKEALVMAPSLKGYDDMGSGGLTGWLLKQAENYPETYLKMLVKALTPIEVQMLTLQQNNQLNVGDSAQSWAPWDKTQGAAMAAGLDMFRNSIRREKTDDLRTMLQAMTSLQDAMKGRANDPVLKRLDAPDAETIGGAQTIETETEPHQRQ